MAYFDFLGGGKAKGDSVFGALFTRLLDSAGNNISKKHRQAIPLTQKGVKLQLKEDLFKISFG
jgi:hypothetical protein